jgi:hypothetical protein
VTDDQQKGKIMQTRSIFPGYRPVMGSCEQGYEPSGSVKGGKFTDHLAVLSAAQEKC